ncbi:MAG: amidohydrolase family protein [Planctomycetes bacterium]|nr:amidohydrolase family protein [Planctomycetota bacterium]
MNDADFKSAATLASMWNVPFTIHYLETPEESAEWAASCHASVAEFLEQVRPLPAVSLAHVNYPSSEDLSRIATNGVTVIWCPRAHSFYGHRNHPWRDMVARGINVALGTDSAGCVPTLSILDEIREARRLSPTVAASELLEMSTLNGAKALGLGDRLGALEAGRLADFAVFRLHDSSEPVVNRLLLPETKIVKTIIGGEVVFEDRVD